MTRAPTRCLPPCGTGLSACSSHGSRRQHASQPPGRTSTRGSRGRSFLRAGGTSRPGRRCLGRRWDADADPDLVKIHFCLISSAVFYSGRIGRVYFVYIGTYVPAHSQPHSRYCRSSHRYVLYHWRHSRCHRLSTHRLHCELFTLTARR